MMGYMKLTLLTSALFINDFDAFSAFWDLITLSSVAVVIIDMNGLGWKGP